MNLPQEYLAMCRHPEIQALCPEKVPAPVARGPVPREPSSRPGGLSYPGAVARGPVPRECTQPVARGPVPRECLAAPQSVARGPVPRNLAEAENPRDLAESKNLWLPTREQLLALLAEKLPYPETSIFRQTADGWEYQTCLREWAADYGTYIDAHRRFVGTCPEMVLLQALTATLGIGERWMV